MALAPGSHLDGYEILAPLGSGGMGDVYRARDPILKREVAIKVLPASVTSDPDRLRRFEQEAQAAAALNHPNILAVHRFGVFEGAPYLVSELLEGCTLRQLQERGPIATRKAIDIGVQIANGLAAAHERGIVHRDLKPENLFVTKDGRVKILDFGLAKLTQPGTPSGSDAPTQAAGAALNTEPGMVLGTVGYMAPEQVRGLPSNHRADIFAFGAVLYEMLSGKRAFQRSTSADTMAAILNEDPPSISQTSQTTPPGLQRVVQRCLEKNPEQRFQSASDLGFALEALSESGSSSNVAVVVTKRRGLQRWTGWSLALVAILAIAAGSYFLIKPKLRVPFEHYSIQKIIDNKHVRHLAISPDGNYLAVIVREASGTEALFLHHIPTNSERPILQNATYKYDGLSFSPDGNYIYFFLDSGHLSSNTGDVLYKVPVLGGQVTRVLERVDSKLSFIDNDHKICFYRDDRLNESYKIISATLEGTDEKLLATYKYPLPALFACEPDGKSAVINLFEEGWDRLVFSTESKQKLFSTTALGYGGIQRSSEDDIFYVLTHTRPGSAGQISLLFTSTGTLHQLTNDLSSYTDLSLTFNERTLAATIYEANDRFAEYSLDNSNLNERPVEDIIWFDWLDDSHIVESSLSGEPRLFDLLTNETKSVTSKTGTNYFHAARCGKDSIVAAGQAGGSRITHIFRLYLDGRQTTQLTNGQTDFFPQCSSDGKWLYFVDLRDDSKPYLVRQLLSGAMPQRIMQENIWFDISPDGKLIVTTVDDQTTRGHFEIRSADSLQILSRIELPEDWDGVVSFSANSDSIFYVTNTGSDSTIWRQPLAKLNRIKVASLIQKRVVWIRPSADGKRLGLTITAPTSEAVLLHDDGH